jgi:methionine-rich copper-binding protein CopC
LLLGVIIVLLTALAIAPGMALAHAEVVSSTPADGSTVVAGLAQINITFSEDISPDQSAAQLFKAGTQMSGVTSAVDRADRTKMSVTAPALDAGQYQLKWQAVTEDDNGHTNGAINFTVGAAGNCTTFPETGKTVCDKFMDYWNNHGGLAQQGYPISGEMQEVSDTDGKTYTVQYFERAVFEMHPENQPPNDIELSLLGNFLYKQKYPNGAPNQTPNTSPGSQLFTQTGHRVGGKFLDYWNSHGGLVQQGYPISDEFQEVSPLDGKTYTVQYFERAVFESHPENQPPYDVLLSQLGTFMFKQKYPSGQ